MKVTYCDRCGKEVGCNGIIQRFTIFDTNKSLDLCDNCHKDFVRWLELGESIKYVRENIERSN
jgi:hypothetical protein